jgi:AmmeMemoRadiSam system protein B/AmmeMemoRadiSam system protein A
MLTAPVHRSPLAGSWYPAAAGELAQLLSASLETSRSRTGSFVRPGALAFLVPHAAPAYSGTVASSVYRHIQASGARRVVVLGFSHRLPIRGIAIPQVESIETPLGAIRIDREAADSLAAASPFHHSPEPAVCDHSVEIQIPYLQTLVPDAALVPLYIGHLTANDRARAAAALRALLEPGTVLVASSDLTHYGPDFGYLPFSLDHETPERLQALDGAVLAASASLDSAILTAELERTGATVCGAGPLRLLLETLAGLGQEVYQETLDYATSGALTRNYRHSVGYGAAGYFPASAYEVDARDRAALLAAARRTLDASRRTGNRFALQQPPGPALKQRGRAFVSLYSKQELRGCTGYFDHPIPLAEAVPRLALAAAYEDRRFAPLAPDEELEIEVHILTPPKPISRQEQFVVGEHGATIKCGVHRGLLLPCVATEHNLSREQFFHALARKAGLGDSVYSDPGCELAVFRGQTFREPPR